MTAYAGKMRGANGAALCDQPTPGHLEEPQMPSAGYKLIPLHHRGEVVAYAKVDEADYEALGAHRWRLHSKGYAERGTRPTVLMHREIMVLTSQPGHAHKGRSPEVDHINRDKLDNRRENLRVVDRSTNNQNKEATGKSGVLNVHWDSRWQKWRARARIDGRQVDLGYYKSKADAVARVREHLGAESQGEQSELSSLRDQPEEEGRDV
jgi:hypothetical protein